jgi:alpha-tubulin suppressor-like RCC1 family protein
MSCGSNEHGVLGQKLSISMSLVPRNVEFPQKASIKGFVASRYHSVFYNSKKIFTCGSNRGQLGHSVDVASVIYEPKLVSRS